MSIDFDITTSDKAYSFLIDSLGFAPDYLIMEYLVDCNKDLDLFWERNKHYFQKIDISDIRFIAFHVTASLDDCKEIRSNGLRDLQFVLSHNTKLSRLLERCKINFDIENRKMRIGETEYNIDYNYYQEQSIRNAGIDKRIKFVAHRIFYDYCIDGFFYCDQTERYGTDIHKRPEFIDTLISLSHNAEKLDSFWRENSKPYKVIFYATAEQIHKFTFDLEKNTEPYSANEQECVKRWMMFAAVDRAFDPCLFSDKYIYIRNGAYIPPEQIIGYECIDSE